MDDGVLHVLEGKLRDCSDRSAPRLIGLGCSGFSVVELMVVGAIMAILGTVAVQSYQSYLKKNEIQKAIDDIKSIEMFISLYEQEDGSLPNSLNEVPGLNNPTDPWGRAYVYVPFNQDEEDTAPKKNGNQSSVDKARKDRYLHPINTDYDLYSVGEDGKTTLPLTAKISQDDVIRANNGGFVGLASDY
jgi:general secretion pathway protein G